MATIHRVLTIEMVVDTDTHIAKTRLGITEEGEEKKEFRAVELVTISRVFANYAEKYGEAALGLMFKNGWTE